jgi:hypothetical protein
MCDRKDASRRCGKRNLALVRTKRGLVRPTIRARLTTLYEFTGKCEFTTSGMTEVETGLRALFNDETIRRRMSMDLPFIPLD